MEHSDEYQDGDDYEFSNDFDDDLDEFDDGDQNEFEDIFYLSLPLYCPEIDTEVRATKIVQLDDAPKVGSKIRVTHGMPGEVWICEDIEVEYTEDDDSGIVVLNLTQMVVRDEKKYLIMIGKFVVDGYQVTLINRDTFSV